MWIEVFWIGATNRIWTYDPLITNEMLCQLSYSGKYSIIIGGLYDFVNYFFLLNCDLKELTFLLPLLLYR